MEPGTSCIRSENHTTRASSWCHVLGASSIQQDMPMLSDRDTIQLIDVRELRMQTVEGKTWWEQKMLGQGVGLGTFRSAV